jgi:hypothetical protein
MPLKAAYKGATLALAGIVAASVAAYVYLQSEIYFPVVRLDLPDGLSIAALLPQAKDRKACGAASDRFVAPFKQTCKDCKITVARCERHLEGLELAMREGTPIAHPIVVAREVRLAVLGPLEKAKAGCQFLATSIASRGERTAVCIQPAAPKS